MAVSTSFVVCPDSEWTAICQQNPTRTAMMVQLLAGDAVLGVNTNGPMVETAFGSFPCGVWTSLVDGNSLNPFRMSAAIDADLVTQEWFIWPVGPVGSTAVPVYLSADNQDNGFGVGPPTAFAAYTVAAQVLIAAAFAVVIGNVAPVVTSALLGVLAPTAIQVTPSESGTFGFALTFAWAHPGGADTVTITDGATGWVWLSVYLLPGAIATDQAGTSSGTGGTNSVTTAGPVASVPQIALAAFLQANFIGGGAGFVAPAVLFDGGAVVDNNALSWGGDVGYATVTAIGAVTVTFLTGPLNTDFIGVIETITLPLGSGTSIVTVIESFDVVVPPPADNFLTVPLPRLDAGAIEALKTLQAQILAKDALPVESTDAG